MTRPAERFPWGATIAVVPAMALLIWLGVWQLQRLHWKEDLLRHVAAARAARAEPAGPVLAQIASGADRAYARVSADCPTIEETPFLRVYAVTDGVAGYRIVTPCSIAAGPYRTLLVDRGFISLEDADRLASTRGRRLDGPIVGVLRDPGGKTLMAPPNNIAANVWHYRDIAAMAAALHATSPAPVFLMLEKPSPEGFGPKPQPLPLDIPNNHLGYAITWFGLALALAAVYASLLVQRLKRMRTHTDPDSR